MKKELIFLNKCGLVFFDFARIMQMLKQVQHDGVEFYYFTTLLIRLTQKII